MITQQEAAPALTRLFTEAMTCLVTGVSVVTAQRADGRPCGLLVSSICSYSVKPPSVLIAVDQASRSYTTLVECAQFGVHVLSSAQGPVASVFASRSDDKFADVPWYWDAVVPRLADVPVYLPCRARAVFRHGDHAIIIGDVISADVQPADPLVCYRRRLGWQLRGPDPVHRDG
jgi:flavin reductase ActVB